MLNRILSLYAYSESGAAAGRESLRLAAGSGVHSIEVEPHDEDRFDVCPGIARRTSVSAKSERGSYGLERVIDLARRTVTGQN